MLFWNVCELGKTKLVGRLSEVPFLIDNEKYIKYTLEKNEVIF